MFYVYYRHSKGKGYKEFKTRDAQRNFICRAPMTYVITAFN